MSGIAYPIGFTNGAINLVPDEPTQVSEALRHLLNTQLNERLWFPEFGYSPDIFDPKRDLTTETEILKMILTEYMSDYDFKLKEVTGAIDSSGYLKFIVRYNSLGYEYTQVSTRSQE